MSNIKIGIIGAGNISKEHLEVLKFIDYVDIVGITSRTLSKAKKLAYNFNIIDVYDNPEKLIERSNLDGLMVLVSADQIYKVTKELIPFQIPLFIEKPPGLVPGHTKTLLKLANKHGTINMVGYNRRYYSIFHKGLEIINKHGQLLGVSIEGHERFWKISSKKQPKEILDNWIIANSTHTIDLIRFFGGEINNIRTFTNNIKEQNGDQFVASFEYASGSLGTYTSHWFSPGGWSVKLYGNGVTIIYNPLEKGMWFNKEFQKNEIIPDRVDQRFKPGFYRQMEAFLKLIKTRKLIWPSMDLNDSFRTIELANSFSYV